MPRRQRACASALRDASSCRLTSAACWSMAARPRWALDVLIALVARPGQLITKNELLDRVWPDVVVEENNLQVQIRHLRKLLGSEWPRRAKPMRWRAVMPSSSPPASGARTMRVEMSLATQLSMLLVLMVSTKADLPRIAGRQRRTDSCGGSSYHCNRR